MEIFRDRCKNCAHEKVCKYMEEFWEACEDIRRKMCTCKTNGACIQIVIRCPYKTGRESDEKIVNTDTVLLKGEEEP